MTNVLDSLLMQQVTPQKIDNGVKNKSNKKVVKAASIAGSLVGIGAAVTGVYALGKTKNPALTFKNLRYEEADVLLVGAGSVLGGLTGGLIADKDKNNINPKLREASQQFFGNMVSPLGFLALGNKLLDKLNIKMPQIQSSSPFANWINRVISYSPKIIMTIGALMGGMEIGNKIMNEVNNKVFKEEVKHDVHAEDYLVHADDICLTANMLLKDFKSISAVTSKILPLTFVVSGAKTGMAKNEKSNQ